MTVARLKTPDDTVLVEESSLVVPYLQYFGQRSVRWINPTSVQIAAESGTLAAESTVDATSVGEPETVRVYLLHLRPEVVAGMVIDDRLHRASAITVQPDFSLFALHIPASSVGP